MNLNYFKTVFLETKEQGFVSNVTSILNSFINDTINIELVTTNKNNAFEFKKNLENLYSLDQINEIILILLKTQSYLQNNANSRLVFDVMSIDIPEKTNHDKQL